MQNKFNSLLRSKNSVLLFACSIYLLIFCGFGFMKGEFLDGLTYSSISRNLSIDQHFFQLSYTATHYSSFHEQPPFFFWIQSIFFSILGDHFWVEYLMSLFILLSFVFISIKLLKEIANTNKNGIGLYLICLLIVPIFSWSFKNNMIESLIMLFSIISIWFQFKAQKQDRNWLLLFLGGFSISLAILSKGLIALFPLAVTPLHYFIYRQKKIGSLIKEVLIISIGLIAPILCLMIVSDFRAYMFEYWNVQVVSSLTGKREVMNRWILLVNLLQEQGLLFAFFIVTILSYSFTKIEIAAENKKHSIFFLLIALSASLPLLISPKQHSYYIVPSIPFFALAFFFYSRDLLKQLLSNNILNSASGILSLVLIILSVIAVSYQFGKIRKNKDKTEVAYYFKDHHLNNKTIKIEEQQDNLWIWVATLQRYGRNSVCISDETPEYLISDQIIANQNELLFKNEKYLIYKINP